MKRIFLFCVLINGIFAFEAHSKTFNVNSDADVVDIKPGDGSCKTIDGVCTLRAAIQEANAFSGEDTVSIPEGTYKLSLFGFDDDGSAGDLDILDDIIIVGAGIKKTKTGALELGKSFKTVIDGNNSSRVFHVINGNAKFSDLEIVNGSTSGNGGGVSVERTASKISFSDVSFYKNTSKNSGGGLYMVSSFQETVSLILERTYFVDNEADAGGGILLHSVTAQISDSIIKKNAANSDGGGIYLTNSDVSIENTKMSYNSSIYGGALEGVGTKISIINSEIKHNYVEKDGGALYLNSVDYAYISQTTIDQNTASNSGGGFYLLECDLYFENGTVSNNLSMYTGGGLFASAYDRSEIYFVNSTISGNEAAGGGGVHTAESSIIILYFQSSTITNNNILDDATSINSYGGIDAGAYTKIKMKSSIFSGNGPDNCYAFRGNFDSEDYNFFETGISDSSCYLTLASHDIEEDHTFLDLGDLQDNGGLTKTHALGSDSYALRKGTCEEAITSLEWVRDWYEIADTIITDQRGLLRGRTCDIGSFDRYHF